MDIINPKPIEGIFTDKFQPHNAAVERLKAITRDGSLEREVEM